MGWVSNAAEASGDALGVKSQSSTRKLSVFGALEIALLVDNEGPGPLIEGYAESR